MPLVEISDFLCEEVVANGVDRLPMHVADFPGVYKSAALPGAFSTLAREVDTHFLNHINGEDISSLHIGLVEEEHPHFLHIALVGGI